MLPKKIVISILVLLFLFFIIALIVLPLDKRSGVNSQSLCGPYINTPVASSTLSGIYTISGTYGCRYFVNYIKIKWADARPLSSPTYTECSTYESINTLGNSGDFSINVDTGKMVNTVPNSAYRLYVEIGFDSTIKGSSYREPLYVSNIGGTGNICQTPQPPSPVLTANPATVNSGESSQISWNGYNAASCSIKTWPTTITPMSPYYFYGSNSTGPLTQPETYNLTCFNSAGNQTNKNVTVNINSSTNPPPSTPPGSPVTPESSTPPGSSTPTDLTSTSGNNNSQSTTTTSGETIISPETVTTQTLASTDKLVIEEEIPVSITEFDPDIFLKGSNIKLNSIKNIKKDNKNYIYFEGKTKPNTLVTLYIFSNPIIVTLKSDSKGNWNYEREKRIETGKHSAFATIYDDGVTRRSDVTSFFVAKNSKGNLVLKQTAFDNLLFYGLIIGTVIAFSIVILIMYRIYINKKAQI